MTSWEESGGEHGAVVPGVPVEQTGRAVALQVSPDRVGAIAVGDVFVVDGDDPFAGEPLDLGRTQASATELYLGGVAAQLIGDRRRAEEAAGPRPVEISLEAALRDPESVLDMIKAAPLSDFHERVLRANKAAHEARFNRYVHEEKPGLWASLALHVPGETAAARRYDGTRPGKAKNNNREQIGEFKLEDMAPLNKTTVNSLSTGGALYSKVHDYILTLDNIYEKGQPDADRGLAEITPNPHTQERLERLAAVRFPHEVEQGGRGQRHHKADMLKLSGLGHTIERLWAKHHKHTALHGLASEEAGAESMSLPDELLDAEALYTALLAEYRLKVQGRKAVIAEMAATINSMEEIRGGLEEVEDIPVDGRLFRLDLGTYGERAFQRAIQTAGASWRVVSQLDPGNLPAFEGELLGQVFNELAGFGLLGSPRDRSGLAVGSRSALDPSVRAAMDAAQFEDRAAEALAAMASADPAAVDSAVIEQFLRATGDAAARRRDTGGRYRETRARRGRDAAAERRAEDYPGAGRLLTYYGSYWTEDGAMGPLEAMAARSGAYHHIDSAGMSPMREAAVRRQLKRMAPAGHPVQVHAPFDTIPGGYLCETAHFVGLLPNAFEPRHILSVVIPNGLATMSEETNPELAEHIQLSGARALYKSIPTALVRFLRSPRDGRLRFDLGHIDPDIQSQLEGHERTLAIFMDKEDGTPSDLFQLLFPEEAAALMGIAPHR